MSKKSSSIRQGSFGRGLAVSLAGLRAGGAFAIDGALQRLRPHGQEELPADSPFIRREARRFVAELGRLKGTYVKIGQMFALLGEHFLPRALTEALQELNAATEPLPWEEIEPELRASLGARLEELEVEHEALAAASLAQVHRATVTATGEQICLKVQYPGLREVIDSDFDAVVRMLLLARWVKAGRELDDWLESMRAHLHQEIDYRHEAQMGDTVAELVARDTATPSGSPYYVPRRFPRYCSDDVLALEYIDGYQVNRPEVAALSQRRRNALGRNMLELLFHELYRWGVLQTDPNFGNYLIRSGRRSDELVLLDFGSTLSCEQTFLRHLGNAIAAGQEQDREALLESLIGLDCLDADSSVHARESFTDFCLGLLEPLRPPAELPAEYLNDKGEYCWGRSRLLRRAGKAAASSAASLDFTTPSRDFALIARKLTGVYTFIAVLDAEFNAHDLVRRHIRHWRENSE
ncbi:AarF/ABC1/UbiB kinase family protein [Haliea sp. E1-2-M8]|uniref:ABC1 kinase family protein n=1 Tax=Haliea sp. E1-2-M8 TaxID=3064706 RepID=UPI0027244201|nr:AarF/ABC1/UbiB kinase family protein [Haliea sp. E1-2-M8]MDO8860612.1 AarF/ABC1/UbiB kinase family protein [Haliea sp. E1-2-M8]